MVFDPSSVKDDGRTDVFGIGCRKVQSIIGAQRETNHCQALVGLSHKFVEKLGCLRDLGLGLEMVSVERFAKSFRSGDVPRDLAMIEVRGEGDETGFGQTRAKSLDCFVQSPPGMQYQYTGSLARGRLDKKTLRLRTCHVNSL